MAANVDNKQTFCTTCGAQYNASAKYCGVDGTALRPTTDNEKPTRMTDTRTPKVCSFCGTIYPPYAQFCAQDATKLHNQPAAPTDDTVDDDFNAFMASDEERAGAVIAGKYRVESLLGEGGMAKVYRAVHMDIEKTVVIKLMRNQFPAREKDTSIKRFLQEIKITAKLNHPNIVSVYDGGEMKGRPYLVMEYIKGESLRAYSTQQGQLPFSDAINIVSQICAGLSEAHNEGIVHRDLKPENIMLREDSERPDWVKIVDFGIAHLKQGGSKLTATGIAIGTVDYMSPEYLSDKPIDHRADIYALGVILHELLTGKCPFESEVAEAVMAKHLWSSPMPPSQARKDMVAGCALDRIVFKALEKEPGERFQSTLEMRKALQEALSNPGG